MGFFKTGGIVVLISIAVYYFFNHYKKEDSTIPKIKVEWWAEGPARVDDRTIIPFKISFPQEEINTLKEKLYLTRPLAPPLEGIGFQYGFNTKYLNSFIDYWRTKYNWTEREAFLNKFPQFKTQIGGLDIHFIHVKPDLKASKGKKVLPLLLVHGWPGSVREFYDLIPLLTTPRHGEGFVFEVVVPSLPGFGFSDKAVRVGCGPPQIGAILAELMTRLGFSTFYYQGGDWGSVIGHVMSVLYPERILAFHCNFCLATTFGARMRAILAWFYPPLFVDKFAQEIYSKQFFDYMILESGYFHIQATKPDTIGVALTDSPAGFASYILEKVSTATNKSFRSLPDGGLEKMNKDDLLDNIMIYWLTNTITSSMRIYSEYFVKETYTNKLTSLPVKVPTHCARFPNEILFYPAFVLNEQYNLISVSDFQTGGHFAAFEEPKMMAEDIWNFIRKVRGIKKS